jgi:hypothetical protein
MAGVAEVVGAAVSYVLYVIVKYAMAYGDGCAL